MVRNEKLIVIKISECRIVMYYQNSYMEMNTGHSPFGWEEKRKQMKCETTGYWQVYGNEYWTTGYWQVYGLGT